MKVLATLLFSCLTGTCAPASSVPDSLYLPRMDVFAMSAMERDLRAPFDGRSPSGNYLASQFAQRRHDWSSAGDFMNRVIDNAPETNTLLLSKAMVLSMGAGRHDRAMAIAHQISLKEPDNSLALLFLAMDSFQKQQYTEASEYIGKMQEGSLSEFINPLLQSWARASQGEYSTEQLTGNTIHLYHAILIADFLGKKDEIEKLVQTGLAAQGLSLEDLERMADAYTRIGKIEPAKEIYKATLEQWPDEVSLARKLDMLEHGKAAGIFKPVRSPEQGVARASFDMARLLYQEFSDESARVFANMALYLNPNMPDAELLMAHITARNERYDDAIAYYQAITPGDENFLEARRLAAGLMEDTNQTDRALAELQSLFRDYKDLDSLIEIGDIYREHKDYAKAIVTYNQAEENLGKTIPKEYWHLHYVRGMSYEQLGQWDKAEADLKAALAHQPEHPFILNYLGYAWADQGMNLEQSLGMIRKAVTLRPDDGSITDSLGWVLYRMGRYEEAVPHLEKAVELMPYDSVINDHLGDAYWRVGRKLEARFQWYRAKNHSEDNTLITQIDQKLNEGLQSAGFVKEASSQASVSVNEPAIMKP